MNVETKPPKPVGANVLIARCLRIDAHAHRSLAIMLHRAELAADWKEVAHVRSELAALALGLDALALQHDPEFTP